MFQFMRRAFAMLIALSFVAGLSSPASAESLRQVHAAEQRVPLPEAARYFGVETSWKPAERRLSFTHEGHRAEILIGSDRLMVDDYLMVLSSPVVAAGGSIGMSLADSAEMFSRLLGRDVTEKEISSAGLIPRRRSDASEANLIKNVRHISYPRFTRLIINVAGERSVEGIDVKCLKGARTFTVELAQSRFMQSADPIEVGDRIVELVEPVQTSADAKLIVRTVPEEIDYEVQKHDDPPRVVVDIKTVEPAIVADFPDDSILKPQPEEWAEQQPIHEPQQFPFTTIVIDPGHGGKDQGARGRGGLLEKNVTLDIALKLKELIENDPGMKVVLTRTGDYFVSLKERTAIANHAKGGAPADLFISIHTNSHKSPKVGGFETFYISDSVDPGAEATAAMENAVVDLEWDMDDSVESTLTPILWDLQFTEFISESSELAFIAKKELGERLNTRNRGVRQAQFIVLAGVAMPSILVEVAFISNRIEEAKLKTADYKNKCAEALAASVAAFKERYETRLGLLNRKSNP